MYSLAFPNLYLWFIVIIIIIDNSNLYFIDIYII